MLALIPSSGAKCAMKFSRCVFFFCFIIGASLYAGDKASTGTAEGTFFKIEQGDYTHLVIKDEKGNRESFIVLQDHPSITPFIKNENELQGRRIRVHWKNAMIPEAGEKMKTVTKVEERRGRDE